MTMLRCILLAGALLAPCVFAQTMATDAPPAPEMSREQKLTQFRHDQINLLALRPEPESLLSAALLADADVDDKARPAVLKPPALLKRAQKIGENSVLVWWVTATAECRAAAKSCPEASTLQKLESIDPENAAVWMLSMWRAQQANDAPAARAALASGAQAKRYNDYFGALVSAVYEAQDVLPMSDDLLKATGADASVAGYRLVNAANIVLGKVASPGGRALAQACHNADATDSALIADCIAIARKMELSGSLFAQNAGLALREELLTAGPERDALQARKHGLAWQMERMSELAGSLANDAGMTRTYTQALAATGDESAAVYAVLRSKGIGLEPPAGWHPSQAKAPLKP
jgi:hypothetical protein